MIAKSDYCLLIKQTLSTLFYHHIIHQLFFIHWRMPEQKYGGNTAPHERQNNDRLYRSHYRIGDVTEQIHLQEVPLFGFCWNVDVLFDKWLAL